MSIFVFGCKYKHINGNPLSPFDTITLFFGKKHKETPLDPSCHPALPRWLSTPILRLSRPTSINPSKIGVSDIDQSESPTPTDRCRGLRFRGSESTPNTAVSDSPCQPFLRKTTRTVFSTEWTLYHNNHHSKRFITPNPPLVSWRQRERPNLERRFKVWSFHLFYLTLQWLLGSKRHGKTVSAWLLNYLASYKSDITA